MNIKVIKMAVISDLHVMAPQLLVSEGKAFEDYLIKDRKMLRESADAVAAYYQETGADGFILATNKTAVEMVDKTLPNAYIVDISTTYIN